MKTANLERQILDLRTKGFVELPDLQSFSVRDIYLLIGGALSIKTIQRAITAIDAPIVQQIGNAPYYSRLYVEAALIYLKFTVRK